MLEYLAVFILIAVFYLVIRLIAPLRLNVKLKPALCLILLLCGLSRPYIHELTGGSPWSPQAGRGLMLTVSFLSYTVCFLFALTLLSDLIKLLLRCVKMLPRFKGTSGTGSRPAHSLKHALIFSAAAVLIAFEAVWSAITPPAAHELELTVRGLPQYADGYKIAFLTDLHISSLTKRELIQGYVSAVNEAKPDLILIGGDLQDGFVPDIGDLCRELFALRARDGIYAVSGNHEYYWGYARWRAFYQEGGFRFLDHETLRLRDEKGRVLFNLAGFADAGCPELDRETLDGADKDYPTVVLAHRPTHFKTADGLAAAVLSGHTHGGLSPVLQPLVARRNDGLVSGIYQGEKGSVQVVSNGTSTWMTLPFRLGVPSEIWYITLRAEPGGDR